MARALSVGDENGATSCGASQSRDGTDWRGNLAACVSGPEKSRQSKHDVTEGGFCCRRFLAWERSGRDASGTGGGTPLVVGGREWGIAGVLVVRAAGNDLPPAAAFELFWSGALSIPNDRPGLAGIGGGIYCITAFSTAKESWRAGNRGGTDGTLDSGGLVTVITPGSLVSAFTGGILPFSTVRAERFGGRGGRLEGSKAGAIIRP